MRRVRGAFGAAPVAPRLSDPKGDVGRPVRAPSDQMTANRLT
jgi:hypothetical protein